MLPSIGNWVSVTDLPVKGVFCFGPKTFLSKFFLTTLTNVLSRGIKLSLLLLAPRHSHYHAGATESNWKQLKAKAKQQIQLQSNSRVFSSNFFPSLPPPPPSIHCCWFPPLHIRGRDRTAISKLFPTPTTLPLHHLHYPPLHHHHSVQQEHKCPQPCFLNSNPFLNGTHTIKNSAHWMQYIIQSNRIGFKFFARKKLNAMFVHSHSTQPKNVQM